MAPAIAYTLPAMQLVCNLVVPDGPRSSLGHTDLSVNLPSPPVLVPKDLGSSGTNAGTTVGHSTSQIPSGVLPEGYIAHPDIGVAYKTFNASISWKSAREQCIQKGARLAVTDSHIKFEHLMSQAPWMNAIHVGIHRMYDDAEWVSATTGSTIASPPWAPGYPNGVYDCILAGYNPRGVKNLACASGANYACELPIPQDYDGQKSQQVNIGAN